MNAIDGGAGMTANSVAEWAGAVGAWVIVIGFTMFIVAVTVHFLRGDKS